MQHTHGPPMMRAIATIPMSQSPIIAAGASMHDEAGATSTQMITFTAGAGPGLLAA